MSNGERWEDFVDYAIACPVELEFGTKVLIGEKVWECKDRGGAIVYDGEAYWIDQLTADPQYRYGEKVEGIILEDKK